LNFFRIHDGYPRGGAVPNRPGPWTRDRAGAVPCSPGARPAVKGYLSQEVASRPSGRGRFSGLTAVRTPVKGSHHDSPACGEAVSERVRRPAAYPAAEVRPPKKGGFAFAQGTLFALLEATCFRQPTQTDQVA
jgi:hypothetical protein